MKIIDTIDWDILSKRYNDRYNKNISYQGSKIEIEFVDEEYIVVQLYLKVIDETNKTKEHNPMSFKLYKNSKDGSLHYYHTYSSRLAPPNTNSLNINCYYLLDVISDYITPFVKKVYN